MNHLTGDWKVDRLKDVALINGVSLPANTDPDYEFDYLEISNVNYYGVIDSDAIERLRYEDAPSRARRRVGKNSTIMSSVRPNLQAVAFLDGRSDLVCSTGFNVVQAHEKTLHPKFVYYTLVSEGCRQYFEATAKGVGYPAVDDKDFGSFPIPLPPLPEQERIAAFLDASCVALDAAVAAKRRQISVLDDLQSVMIAKAVTRGLGESVKLKDSGVLELGQIPAHWRRTKLRYEISVRSGDFASDKLEDDGEYPVIGGNGEMGRAAGYNVDGEIVVVGRVGAYCGNAHYVKGRAWVSDNALIVESNHDKRFLTHLIRVLDFNNTAKKTAQPLVTGTQIKNTYVGMPQLTEQEKIVAFIENRTVLFASLRETLSSQIAILTAYRKSLIHECVTGQRRISEADVARIKLSEKTGQLNLEPSENIGRLKPAGGDDRTAFDDHTKAGRRPRP
ncbi:MAG: restriction endonuclease subunit S [Thermodesulfobacteriota bacterium]|nr:restriction endonuclease subunit S [Thermodesulfobacteriota bacterium]